jgi:uncharacterized repeat protein (TIGR01451 family)
MIRLGMAARPWFLKSILTFIFNLLILNIKYEDILMLGRIEILVIGVALCAIGIPTAVSGQATSPALVVKAVAEVETRVAQDGRDVVKLAPANRVVPGDQVIYTLEIRNAGRTAVRDPTVTYAVPSHMMYVADSATGPGAEVRYSVDNGHFFERPEYLRVSDTDGHSRQAKPDEYTHIRWKLKNTLKSNSVAYARFRAVVK